MKRITIAMAVLFAILFLTCSAHAGSGKGKRAVDPAEREQVMFEEQILPARTIAKVTDAYLPQLRACWEKHASMHKRATGYFQIELIIHPTGMVWRKKVVADGVKGVAFERCVASVVDQWSFPYRSGFSTAVVPILFLNTRAVGAGPAHSCWKATGCRKHPHRKHKRR